MAANINVKAGMPEVPKYAPADLRPNWKRSLAIVALLCLVSENGGAADWPHWRGPDLNGVSRETGWSTSWPAEGPKQLWKASVGVGFSSVSVGSGRVYTLGNTNETDTIYCFDAESGKELWKYSYACPLDPKYYEGGPGSTPTIGGTKVYTLSKRGQLFCLDAAVGRVLWQRNLMEEVQAAKPQWGFAGSPLIQRNLVLVNVGGAGTAVEKTTGTIVWHSDTNAAGYATPVPIPGEDSVAMFSGKALLGVRVKDGKQLWEFPWIERWNINAADPLVIEDKLFISTFGLGCALLRPGPAGPSVVWQNKALANHFNGGVYLNGFIYGINGNTDQPEKDLRCIDAKTGEVKWKYPGVGLGSLSAAAGNLIVLSDRGELLVAPASPEAFKPVARAQVLGGKCWTVPVWRMAGFIVEMLKGRWSVWM